MNPAKRPYPREHPTTGYIPFYQYSISGGLYIGMYSTGALSVSLGIRCNTVSSLAVALLVLDSLRYCSDKEFQLPLAPGTNTLSMVVQHYRYCMVSLEYIPSTVWFLLVQGVIPYRTDTHFPVILGSPWPITPVPLPDTAYG